MISRRSEVSSGTHRSAPILRDDTILPDANIAAKLTWSDDLDSRGLGPWMIEAAGGAFQGIAGSCPIRPEFTKLPGLAGKIELTIAIHPNAWGGGLARDASVRLLKHGFEDLDLVLRLRCLIPVLWSSPSASPSSVAGNTVVSEVVSSV